MSVPINVSLPRPTYVCQIDIYRTDVYGTAIRLASPVDRSIVR
jgi:hypothetical protein